MCNVPDKHSGKDKPPGESSSDSATGETGLSKMISIETNKRVRCVYQCELIYMQTNAENLEENISHISFFQRRGFFKILS